jgi:hypothetical protein
MPLKHIAPVLSSIQRGLLKKPIRRAGEGPLKWYKRYKRWMDATERHRKWKERPKSTKPTKKGKVKPKKKLTERQRKINARKEAEGYFGIERGPRKKPPKKKPPKKKKKK